jgi:hypothetical protein
MSRTWDIVQTSTPTHFPSEITLTFEKSVTSLSHPEIERGQIKFAIGPTYINSPIVPRTVYFRTSKQRKPQNAVLQEQGGFESKGKKVRVYLDIPT